MLFLIMGTRLFYPFELEWIEGANLDQAKWILDGNFPYGIPSINIIPLSYTPIFFYLSAGLMKLIGIGYVAPRLISIIATFGCLLLLFLIASGETKRIVPGIIAAGIYAASYRFTGAWMDLAKTDSLFLFLILLAFFVGYRTRKWQFMIVSGLLLVLAYFTKQITLSIVLVLAPISLVTSRGRTWPIWAVAGMTSVAVFVALDRGSDGWFSFYTFDTVVRHSRILNFAAFWKMFLPKMWPALLLTLMYLIHVLKATKPLRLEWSESDWNILGFSLALLLASWSIFFKVWTYANGFLPACLGLALTAGTAYGSFANRQDRCEPQVDPPRLFKSPPTIMLTSSLILLLIQFALLNYNPRAQMPTLEDRLAGEGLLERLRNLPGEVLIFSHGFLNFQAGKSTYLHRAPLGDVVGAKISPDEINLYWRKQMTKYLIEQAIAQQYFDWIITDKPEESWLPNYIYINNIFDEPDIFSPATGARTRPESLMARNPTANGGELPLTKPIFDTLFLTGWSLAQENGRWAQGMESIAYIALEKGYPYQIIIQGSPACSNRNPNADRMAILWNNRSFGQVNIDSCERHIWTLEIPKKNIKKDFNTLQFVFSTTASSGTTASSEQDQANMLFTSIRFVQK